MTRTKTSGCEYSSFRFSHRIPTFEVKAVRDCFPYALSHFLKRINAALSTTITTFLKERLDDICALEVRNVS